MWERLESYRVPKFISYIKRKESSMDVNIISDTNQKNIESKCNMKQYKILFTPSDLQINFFYNVWDKNE